MVFTVTFDAKHHIWEAAALDSSRPVLTCVLIDPSGVLVASDGNMLGIVQADVGGLDRPVVVNAEAVKTAGEFARFGLPATLTLDMKKRQCSVDMGSHTRVWPFYDGAFPNWRAQVPDLSHLTFGLPIGGYDPSLTVKAKGVTGNFGATGGTVGLRGRFVVVDADGKALVVVMPMFFYEDRTMKSLADAYRNLGLVTVKEEQAKVG